MLFDPNNKNVSPCSWARYTRERSPIGRRRSVLRRGPHLVAGHGGRSTPPYARVGEGGVEYHGPARTAIPAGRATVIVFGAGAATISTKSLPTAARIVAIDTGQTGSAWGAATSALVEALSRGNVLAIVALDRDSAHLAEQLSLKKFVPVLALADDRALTSTNIPWIFRLPAQTERPRRCACWRRPSRRAAAIRRSCATYSRRDGCWRVCGSGRRESRRSPDSRSNVPGR